MAFAIDIIKQGEGSATRFRVEDGTYIIGRSPASRIHLPFPEVSERHALLMLRGETATIEDIHSANGTYVNGRPIDEAVTLTPDAVIEIGSTCCASPPSRAEPNNRLRRRHPSPRLRRRRTSRRPRRTVQTRWRPSAAR